MWDHDDHMTNLQKVASIALIIVLTVLSPCIDLPGASHDAMTQ